MPTSTYIPLANLTLGSSAASVTFSSISQAYRDLVLVYSAGNTSGSYNGIDMRFNGDTGSNYSVVYALGNGSATTSGSETNTLLKATAASGASGSAGRINFMDYSATDKHKTVISNRAVADASGYTVGMQAGRWASTSAITSIVLTDQSGYSFTTGSTFSLFGIAS